MSGPMLIYTLGSTFCHHPHRSVDLERFERWLRRWWRFGGGIGRRRRRQFGLLVTVRHDGLTGAAGGTPSSG